MRIWVPTRARISRQITRSKFFLDHISYRVTYITPESERDRYLRAWPNSEVITVPDSFKLSDIRQWLVDTQREDPYHVCFDDDLVFLRRKAPMDIHQRSDMKLQDAHECFQRIEYWLKEQGFAHGALSQRAGNNNELGAFKVVGRATDTHFYNAEVIYREGIQINAVTLRQDFHTTLSLLELGYPNVIDHEFISGQSDNGPGGCSVYRTKEMLEEQAHLLASLHPEFVKVIQKERKGGFGVSTDVRIQWMKAYRSRLQERSIISHPTIKMVPMEDTIDREGQD